MEVLSDVIDLFVPIVCAGCRASGPPLCARCASPLTCPARRDHRPGVPDLWTVMTYDHPVSAIINAYKEKGRKDLRHPLSDVLARAVRAALPPPPPSEPWTAHRRLPPPPTPLRPALPHTLATDVVPQTRCA